MEKKKYVLKNENAVQEKSADGTENAEHIFDMIERFEMCQSNIQDNNDLCMNLFRLKQNSVDEDEVDALQLLCQDLIAIEEQANQIGEEIEIIKSVIDRKEKVSEARIEELLKTILILELHSQEIVDKVLKE